MQHRTRDATPIRFRAILVVATALTIFSTLMAWQLSRADAKQPTPYGEIALLNGFYWYAWALLAPIIIWIANRVRIERQTWFKAVTIHVLAGMAFAEIHIVAQEAFRRGLAFAVTYYREAQDRTVAAAKLETKLVETQLQTLQSQLHPHFLFNTLHAISALMHSNVDQADRMLSRLAALLRMTLDNVGQQEVPLKEELDFLERYLEIEQTRFRDRLTVKFDVQPEALDALVPWMMLQPLVENSIKHGISPQPGPGTIEVLARQENNRLVLEVRDDGVGLTQDALTALQSGIGLSTTRARLHHLFGRDYQFEFHRRTNMKGVTVKVVVPWRTEAVLADKTQKSA